MAQMQHGGPTPGQGGSLLARAKDTFSVLGDPNYRWFWASMFCYYTGMQMEMLARGWLAWELTESAWLFGWVVLSQGAPSAVMALIGGTMADRLSKRYMVMAAQVILAVTGAMLCVLIATGLIEWWHLAAIGVIKGITGGFTMPARLSMVSEVVDEPRFMRAYALYYVALNTMHVLGPSIAGAIIWVTGGAAGAYLVITIAHLAGLFLLFPVKLIRFKEITHPPSFLQGLGDTFSFALHNPTIMVLLGAEMGIVFFAAPVGGMLPVFNGTVYFPGAEPQVTAAGLAALQVAQGVGGLVGSFIVAALASTNRKPLMLLTVGILEGIIITAFAINSWFPLGVLILGLEGITRACYTTFNSTLFQVSAPPEYRGRAISLYLMGNNMRPLGIMPISGMVEVTGAQVTFGAAGALLVAYMTAVALKFSAFRKREV